MNEATNDLEALILRSGNIKTTELVDLGWTVWGKWSKASGHYLCLCPRGQFDLIPNGTVLYSINGDGKTKGQDDIDLDHRGGFLAWGLITVGEVPRQYKPRKYRSIEAPFEPQKP